MVVKILPNLKRTPPNKLADVEVLFTEGEFSGLRLTGFAVWAPRNGVGGRNVTFPSRNYTVGKQKRSCALLRPSTDKSAGNAVTALILKAYGEWEAQTSTAPM